MIIYEESRLLTCILVPNLSEGCFELFEFRGNYNQLTDYEAPQSPPIADAAHNGIYGPDQFAMMAQFSHCAVCECVDIKMSWGNNSTLFKQKGLAVGPLLGILSERVLSEHPEWWTKCTHKNSNIILDGNAYIRTRNLNPLLLKQGGIKTRDW